MIDGSFSRTCVVFAEQSVVFRVRDEITWAMLCYACEAVLIAMNTIDDFAMILSASSLRPTSC